MKYSPAWASFEANSDLPDGRVLQPPPAGTIARGELPLHYAATKEDAVRAGEELRNPYTLELLLKTIPEINRKSNDKPLTEEEKLKQQSLREFQAGELVQASVQRGAEVYRVFCVSCHGPSGAGDGPVAKRGFPPPTSMLTGKSLKMADGQLFHILTYGQGSMSPFAGQLSRDRRWDVINYVRDLQKKAPPVPATAPPAEPQQEPEKQVESSP